MATGRDGTGPIRRTTNFAAMYGNFGVLQKCRGGVVIAVGQFKDVAVDGMATSVKDGFEGEKRVRVGNELDVFPYALILRVESGLRFAGILTATKHQEECKSGGSSFDQLRQRGEPATS